MTKVSTPNRREQRMVRLPPDLHDQLKQRARAEDLTISQALRRAVRRYLEEQNEPLT